MREATVTRCRVPVDEVRPHVVALATAEVPLATIAAHAGCSEHVVHRVLTRACSTVTAATATALLSVRLDRVLTRGRPGDMLPVTGARRRVQALLALGHDHATITAAMPAGRSRDVTSNARTRWISRALHDAVVVAYDALSMTPGTNRSTRGHALALGYAPPLAWDDDTIDDPHARPRVAATRPRDLPDVDEIAVERALAGIPTPLNRLERERAIPVLAARGWSDAQIAAACGCTDRTVQRIRKDLGVPSTRKDRAA